MNLMSLVMCKDPGVWGRGSRENHAIWPNSSWKLLHTSPCTMHTPLVLLVGPNVHRSFTLLSGHKSAFGIACKVPWAPNA